MSRGYCESCVGNFRDAGSGQRAAAGPCLSRQDTFDVGMDLNAAVGGDYQTPFEFTGTIQKVTIDLEK